MMNNHRIPITHPEKNTRILTRDISLFDCENILFTLKMMDYTNHPDLHDSTSHLFIIRAWLNGVRLHTNKNPKEFEDALFKSFYEYAFLGSDPCAYSSVFLSAIHVLYVSMNIRHALKSQSIDKRDMPQHIDQLKALKLPDKIVVEIVMQAGFVGGWKKWGSNIFYMEAGLAQQLFYTDILCVNKEIKLPYPCFYFSFERGLPVYDPIDKALRDIIGCYIADSTQRGLWVQLIYYSPDRDESCIRLALPKTASIEKAFMEYRRAGAIPDEYISTNIKVINLIYNAIMYCTSKNRVIEVVPSIPPLLSQKKKKVHRYNNQCHLSYTVLKPGICFRPEHYNPTGRHLSGSFWVRGHWREQPYGHREAPTYEIIWIEPFIKGREQINNDRRVYSVK